MADTTEDKVKEAIELFKNIAIPGIPEETIQAAYDVCAEHYDKFLAEMRYLSPYLGARYLSKYLENRKDAHILDVAAGTGLVGEELKKLGYENMDALDCNRAMLNVAEQKGCYRQLICDSIGKTRLDILEDTYDAVVTTGSFVPGHLNDECFEEVIRIVKTGGFFVMVIGEKFLLTSTELKERLEPRIQQLQEKGSWRLLLRETIPNYLETENCVAFVLQIE